MRACLEEFPPATSILMAEISCVFLDPERVWQLPRSSCKLFCARSSSCVYFLPPRLPNKAGRFLVRHIRDIISPSEHRHFDRAHVKGWQRTSLERSIPAF
jgi:hypothetical protein